MLILDENGNRLLLTDYESHYEIEDEHAPIERYQSGGLKGLPMPPQVRVPGKLVIHFTGDRVLIITDKAKIKAVKEMIERTVIRL